jgi:rhamnogalacturonan endolyase
MLRVIPRSLALMLVALAGVADAQTPVDLFRDDFSRFPPGLLSEPLGRLNPAIQEYHYLAHRGVPTGPWANAICYLDSWAAGTEADGTTYLEQHLPPSGDRMATQTFSPLFVTGDPEWGDYTVEVSVRPLSVEDMAGVVFRYHTNRHHYLFCLRGGKQARLALRLPIEEVYREAAFRELGTAEFPYDTDRYYRLKVECRGPEIRASIDGKLVLSAEDAEIPGGKAGLSANIPARYEDFRVSCDPEAKRGIDDRIRAREAELARLRDDNPRPKLWKQFETPDFGAGRNARFGDLDGDGQADMLICQNVAKVDGGNFVEISCLTALNLDGKVLWQVGRPNPKNGLLTSDCPFQIHDLDGDGRNEVVMVKDFKIQVLDGRTGKLKAWAWMPEAPNPSAKEPAKAKGTAKAKAKTDRDWQYARVLGDAVAFANVSGKAGRRDVVIKDRYQNFWVFDDHLKLLWGGQGLTGHYPYPVGDGRDGRDRLAVGYAMWGPDGTQLWSQDANLKDHADAICFGNFTDDPKKPPRAYYSGSDEGFIIIDNRGSIVRHVRIGHAQNASIGKFRTDLPGLQYATINFWKNPGIVTIFDADGEILAQGEPIHSGSSFLPVNWRGDGQEFLLLSGNPREGGMIDGHLRRVVMFPDDGHPDLCAAVKQLTGDARDEVILWDRRRVSIYTQDRPFAGSKVYAPRRNPDYNDSNYRAEVSLPNWEATRPAD